MLEVDPVSLSARIQAGATGPGLEDQLREHGLTLRHFPQSFRVLDPGRVDRHPCGRALRHPLHPHRRSRRVGAGRHPGRDLGLPAAARLGRRGLARPDAARLRGDAGDHHRSLGARPAPARAFAARPASASRASPPGPRPCGRLVQSGLNPAGCRLIDPAEAALTGAGDGQPRAARAGFRVSRARHRAAAGAGAGDLRRPRGDVVAALARTAEPAQAGEPCRVPWAAGARPSCARPTCATPSWPWACCRRPSSRP